MTISLCLSLETQRAYGEQPKWRRVTRHPARAIRVAAARLLAGYRPEVTAQLFTGQNLRVVLPDAVSERLYLHGLWEPNLTSFLVAVLQPGMVMIDVGAHFGYYSQLACLQIGSQGKVIAFEPTPATRAVLKRNLSAYVTATIEPLAVYSRSQALQLQDFGSGHAGFNTVTRGPRPTGSTSVPRAISVHRVPGIRLDEYCKDRRVKPDLVKIDAEGTEWHVLTGMGDLLQADGPIVTLETGDFGEEGKGVSRKCVDLLLGRGYRVYQPTALGLATHEPQESYGYNNLAFVPARFWDAPWCLSGYGRGSLDG